MLIFKLKINTQEDLFNLIEANAEAIREKDFNIIAFSKSNMRIIHDIAESTLKWDQLFSSLRRVCYKHVGRTIGLSNTIWYPDVEGDFVVIYSKWETLGGMISARDVEEQLFREDFEETLK